MLGDVARTGPDASIQEVRWTAADLCTQLAGIGRAVQQYRAAEEPRLVVLTRGAQPVPQEADRGTPTAPPWQATLWGLGLALDRGLAPGRCVLLDLPPEPDSGGPHAEDAEAAAADIVAVLGGLGPKNRLALRGRRWYAPRLIPRPPDTAGGSGVAVRTDATYLVTGGLSGVGDWSPSG
ncbi:hypothetical protein [Streptomyces spectabilis]|uniref:Uncharacterized protein n=1 Tax=Streptomyces spectabilis TaxID=68270 RepID=A0A7W8B3G6_STRST|nr:hypothetical protein [Streptomyces spectabilis]MBB5109669.1 hypothetical protein [Streptomyces spectabilis]